MKNKSIFCILAFAVIIVISAGVSSAQEIVADNNIGVGARSMGMGGTGIASSNDLTALLYNPAALSRIGQTQVQFGLFGLRRELSSDLKSSLGTGSASETTDFSGLGTIGFAYPVPTDQGSLVVGIAYNRVKDFNGTTRFSGYHDSLKGYQSGESIEEGGVGVISLGAAVDVSPNVSIGASIDIWTGDYKRDSISLLNDENDPYSQLDFTGAEDEISAWSFKPSILYFRDGFRFGAYARLPMTFHIKETFYSEGYSRTDGEYFTLYEMIDTYSEFNDYDVTYVEKLTYKVKSPMQLGLGFSWGEIGRKSFAFDMVYENWTQAKLRYPSNITPEPRYFSDKYRSSLKWSIGGERRIPLLDVIGRIGYKRQPLIFTGPSGDSESNKEINVTDKRDFITLGIGKAFDESFMLDVGYAHGIWTQKENPREEEEIRDSVFFSLTYKIPVIQ